MTAPLLIALIGVFVTIAILVGSTTSWLLARNAPQQRRLRAGVRGADSTGILAHSTPVLAQGPDPGLQRLSKYLPRSASEMSRLQKRMTRAGFPHPGAVVAYAAAELLLPIVGFFGVVSFAGLRS